MIEASKEETVPSSPPASPLLPAEVAIAFVPSREIIFLYMHETQSILKPDVRWLKKNGQDVKRMEHLT